MAYLENRGVGFHVGPLPHEIVPIVPAAVIFDLGRGGKFANRPDELFGRRAATAARSRASASGALGAGTGARSHGLQGGVGSASTLVANETWADGIVVAALAVVNSAGSVIDVDTGLPWMQGDVRLQRPHDTERAQLRIHMDNATPTLNTTIGVVATTAVLSKAECSRVATVAHDGMARAIRPVHSMLDGDTVFAVATGRDELPHDTARNAAVNAILAAAADCFAVACTNAIVAAQSNGGAPAYRDLCPSAFPAGGV
jgi:L-aminopeptidase/D-esterase-like protein